MRIKQQVSRISSCSAALMVLMMMIDDDAREFRVFSAV
jgi:hypothetical protein